MFALSITPPLISLSCVSTGRKRDRASPKWQGSIRQLKFEYQLQGKVKKMQIGATEFQKQCLELMSQVEQTREEVVIIKDGKAIAATLEVYFIIMK